ncbi:hypothetical protein [Rickettsiella endosymbiont of Miltochrista miniata]|uniref:hypothetical protein n=1 Tax=Rickettsiella endosymbiont of Miltochrista miniata TaxID=3066239 RepID=UPI00313AC2F0
MNIETKLFHMLRVLSFSESPNKDKLIHAYEKLKKIFISPLFTESILETINELKSNLFYQEFELENDPEFFKAIIKKADDSLMITKLLESLSEIKYSDAEKQALELHLFRVKLLLNLGNDLRKETKYFYEMYSEDFNELKEILFSEKIHYKNLEWFLKSNFSKLVPGSSVSFQTSLNTVFLCLLKNVYPALRNEEVNSLKTIIQSNASQKNPLNHNMFFRTVPFKAKALSPIAQIALKNTFKEYITPINDFKH